MRLLSAELSRFDPLPRVLTYDNFDAGIRGWCRGIPNHANDLDVIPAYMRHSGIPQVSNCQFFDIGTHGAMSGDYAMKVGTRAERGALAYALKRLTSRSLGLVQLEIYFAYRAEVILDAPDGPREWDRNISPSEDQFGMISLSTDSWAGSDTRRWYGTLSYLNTDPDGHLVQQWMYRPKKPVFSKDRVADGAAPPDYVREVREMVPIPGGHQPLCYNETATKINWHYLRWRFNTAETRHEELQVNDGLFDLRDLHVPIIEDEYVALRGLLNLQVGVQTHLPVRNSVYVDSAVISVDW